MLFTVFRRFRKLDLLIKSFLNMRICDLFQDSRLKKSYRYLFEPRRYLFKICHIPVSNNGQSRVLPMKDKLTVAVLLTSHGARARRCVAPCTEGGARRLASSLAGSRLLLSAHTTRLGAVPVARPLRPPVPRCVCAHR